MPSFRLTTPPSILALGAGLIVACAGGERRAADTAAVGGAVDPAVAGPPAGGPSLGDTALATGTGDTRAETAAPGAAGTARTPTTSPAGTTPAAPAGGRDRSPAPGAPAPGASAEPPGAHGQASSLAQEPAPQPPPHQASAPPGTAGGAEPANARAGRASVPFAVGERYVYDVRFGSLDVGDGVMEVLGEEQVRGRDAYRVLFRVSGGTAFFKVRDRYESWMDVRTLQSLRHIQDIDEANYERKSTFEFFPERQTFQENQKPERPTVEQPLDDGSFFFFVRTIPLEVGRSYEFHRYFKPDRNPVRINVLRRERVRVPAGTYDAIVVQPIIKTKGVFGEGGRAEIWLTDDSTRAMVQLKSKLKFGSLNMFLKSVRPADR